MTIRRASLSPARVVAAGRAGLDPPITERLGRAAEAREERRPWFRPKRGWFRRLERAISNALARDVYPVVPGLGLPYGRQLKRHLTLVEAEVGIAGLPPAFDGLKILLITDPHAGPFVSPADLQLAFRRVSACRPDLILLAGDLVTSRVSEFDSHRDAFAGLDAPLGVWAVLGNHDHYTERVDELMQKIEDTGIRVLVNSCRPLERDGQRLWLAGVDDALLGRPELDVALAGTEPPVILLSHNPDLFFAAARRNVALVLSGHTHGGQIRVPGLPVLVRQSRFRLDEGRFRHASTELIVSRGLGAVGLPWRASCPPEAIELRLRRTV